MDIQKLTKKNQEFIHIATNQLIKDGNQTKKSKTFLAMSFLNLSKIRKKELQDVDSLVLQLFGLLVSLLKNTKNLKLISLPKKCQKQIKHLGRCGLIPHSSF